MLDIIIALSVRSAFDKYRQVVPDHVLSQEAKQILKDIAEYFDSFKDVEIVEWDKFESWFCYLKHSSYKQEKLDVFKEIFKNLDEFNTTDVTEEIVRSFIERDFSTKVGDLALKISEGEVTDCLQDARVFIDDYEQTAQIIHDEGFIEDDIIDLCRTTAGGLDWRLDSLNKALGPLRLGNLVVFAKLPESGGTAMAVSECTHFLTQLADDECILYLSNEERGQAIRKRVVSSVINRGWKDWVVKNPVAAKDEFLRLGGERIKIKSVHGQNMNQIKKLVKDTKPVLIVIDQLWKVAEHKKNQGEVAKITSLFEQARLLASEHAPVIAIHQADGSAYSSKYAEMNQMYMSRIGVQGECDAIITLGIDPENKASMTRYMNVCKNKLEGGPDSDESLRHSKWEITLQPTVSRFTG